MLISRVQKYELSKEEIQVIKTARDIIDELYEENFFDQEPFYDYCPYKAIGLMNELLDKNGEAIG